MIVAYNPYFSKNPSEAQHLHHTWLQLAIAVRRVEWRDDLRLADYHQNTHGEAEDPGIWENSVIYSIFI